MNIDVIELFEIYRKILVVCLDLVKTKEDNIMMLNDVLNSMDIGNEHYVNQQISLLKPLNKKTPSEIKTKYEEGDVDYFNQHHADEMSIVKAHEDKLRPFLEKRGYKNLLWWS